MSLLFNIPRRASRVLISGLRDTMRLTASMAVQRGAILDVEALLRKIPRDPRTIISRFRIDPVTRSYVCCPSCFALYIDKPLPAICTHQATPSSNVCNTKLWRRREIRGRSYDVPVRTYLHQEMMAWLGRLLSRPGLEEKMDIAYLGSSSSDGAMYDIWDAPALHTIVDPVSKEREFIIPPPQTNPSLSPEARYVFTLALDGFNPFQNKEAKQTVTTTAIYMSCLNLPPHLRFLPENLYLVGIIPGPHKPSLEEINHALKPLLDELVVFNDSGVLYTRTAKYARGRHVRGALGPLVADLPAARQTAGFASISAKLFCSCCYLELDDIENIDQATWRKRSGEKHKKHANMWKAAQTQKDRDKIFKKYGVRWSELHRLSYWNPVYFTVVDSMHNHYLGLLKDHCRTIWGMNVKLEDNDNAFAGQGSTIRVVPEPSESAMADGWRRLQERDNLFECSKAVLWHLCTRLSLRRPKLNKKYLVKELLAWVCL